MTPQVRTKATKSVGRFLAYCSIMSACRDDRRLSRGTPLALVLILPDGADGEDFRDAANIALLRPGRSRFTYLDEAEKVVAAWDQWHDIKKARSSDSALLRQDRLLILAKNRDEMPAAIVAAVDDVILLPRPTARHITAAVRLCLGKPIEAAEAEELAGMPVSLIEPPRVCRRPFRLSHAAMSGCSSIA